MKPPLPGVTRDDCLLVARMLRGLGAVSHRLAKPRRRVLSCLSCRWPMTDRHMRHVVSHAPALGVPILSTSTGYYLAQNDEDFDCCIRDLTSRAVELYARATAIERLKQAQHQQELAL